MAVADIINERINLLRLELNQGEDGQRRALEGIIDLLARYVPLNGVLLEVTPSATAQTVRHNLGRKPIACRVEGIVDSVENTNQITNVSIIDDGGTDKDFVKLDMRGGDATVTSMLLWLW